MSAAGFVADDGIVHGTRAVVVHPARMVLARHEGDQTRSAEARLEEACGLAVAIDLDVVDRLIVKVRDARPATLFGSGQVEQIADRIRAAEAALLIVDGTLTPIQQRNLETAVGAKIIDRTGLILEIFGARAVTAEGRLQVELAHLDYQAGRLVRSWTHLERQRGGFGFLGGPGETQIEADRRLIRDRMARIRRELKDVTRTRGLHRDRRKRAPWPVIALVGYTNAGKSTLFNRLTGADVMAKDLLFATLDPTMRDLRLPGIPKAILSDTVGFVSDLPTQLVAAFRATLEEVTSADLIVHVRDIAHEDSEAQARDVRSVLADLGVYESGTASVPLMEAWNKIDLIGDDGQRAALLAEAERHDDVVPVSALSGWGLETFRDALSARLTTARRVRHLVIDANEGRARAWLHAHGDVVSENPVAQGPHDGGQAIAVRLSDEDLRRFHHHFPTLSRQVMDLGGTA